MDSTKFCGAGSDQERHSPKDADFELRIRLMKSMWMVAVALVLGASGWAQTMPEWVSELGYKKNEVFPITVKYGFPMVIVQINGKPLELMFDTGNTEGLSLSTDNAASLGLSSIGTTGDYDTNGALLGQVNNYRVSSVAVFGATWSDVKAYELKSDLPGLLGPSYLRDKRFTLDYVNKLLAVSGSDLPKSLARDSVPMLKSDFEGMIVVRGQVNGRATLIQIDTGKSRTCVDKKLIAELSLPQNENGAQIAQVQIAGVTLTPTRAKEVDFSGISGSLPEPILLGIGSDSLKGVVMTVDYRGGVVLLQPQKK